MAGRGKLSFAEKLARAVEKNDSLLCVGLDPDPLRFPRALLAESDPVFAWAKAVVDSTSDLVCAYKPNLGFYEALGLDGLAALRKILDYIPPEVPVILDAKWGDVGHTAAFYARAAFEAWGADAVTVNPYLGRDAVAPFAAYRDRGVFLLCHTSNPGAEDLQALPCPSRPLYLAVAERALEWNEADNIGLVVGATYPEELGAVRELAPDMWLLVPGVGAQGGDLEGALAAGLRADGRGVIISASRSIAYAAEPRDAARDLRDRINSLRRARPSGHPAVRPSNQRLILALHDIGCVQFGRFTLRSGKLSPIYIDLRLLASHPRVLREAARAYAQILRGLCFDRIAAIPYAALPIGTAVALELNRPLIYPRREVKAYGTRRAIEGRFEAGERAVMLDDLVTTGASKLEAIAQLEGAGLKVEDVVVLIDREQGGRERLGERGYRLHAVFGMGEMLDVLVEHGRISPQRRDEVAAFLAEERGR